MVIIKDRLKSKKPIKMFEKKTNTKQKKKKTFQVQNINGLLNLCIIEYIQHTSMYSFKNPLVRGAASSVGIHVLTQSYFLLGILVHI